MRAPKRHTLFLEVLAVCAEGGGSVVMIIEANLFIRNQLRWQNDAQEILTLDQNTLGAC